MCQYPGGVLYYAGVGNHKHGGSSLFTTLISLEAKDPAAATGITVGTARCAATAAQRMAKFVYTF